MKCLLNVSGGSRCRRGQLTPSTHAIRWNMGCSRLDRHRKSTPFSFLTLDRDLSAMQKDQLLHQGKADARALMGARFCPFYPVKALEQARQLGFRDTNTAVCDRKLCVLANPLQANGDAALEGMFEGVREKVEHDLLPHLPVNVDWLGQDRAIHN